MGLKMKIIVNEGCTSDSIDIDGVDFNDFSKQEKLEFLHLILDSINESNFFQIMKSLLQECDNDASRDFYDCDQCNDTAVTTIYEF